MLGPILATVFPCLRDCLQASSSSKDTSRGEASESMQSLEQKLNSMVDEEGLPIIEPFYGARRATASPQHSQSNFGAGAGSGAVSGGPSGVEAVDYFEDNIEENTDYYQSHAEHLAMVAVRDTATRDHSHWQLEHAPGSVPESTGVPEGDPLRLLKEAISSSSCKQPMGRGRANYSAPRRIHSSRVAVPNRAKSYSMSSPSGTVRSPGERSACGTSSPTSMQQGALASPSSGSHSPRSSGPTREPMEPLRGVGCGENESATGESCGSCEGSRAGAFRGRVGSSGYRSQVSPSEHATASLTPTDGGPIYTSAMRPSAVATSGVEKDSGWGPAHDELVAPSGADSNSSKFKFWKDLEGETPAEVKGHGSSTSRLKEAADAKGGVGRGKSTDVQPQVRAAGTLGAQPLHRGGGGAHTYSYFSAPMKVSGSSPGGSGGGWGTFSGTASPHTPSDPRDDSATSHPPKNGKKAVSFAPLSSVNRNLDIHNEPGFPTRGIIKSSSTYDSETTTQQMLMKDLL